MEYHTIKKVLLFILIALCSLLLLLFILFNLPVGHRFITARVNVILKGAGVPVHITSINRILPKSISVRGVTLTGPENDTIIYAGEIDADFFPLALFKKRIIISEIYLGNTIVNISRGKTDLNIAEAFSNGKTDTVPETIKAKKNWEFSIGRAEISGISFQMNDSVSGINVNQKIGDIRIEINRMSLPGHTVMIRSLDVDGSSGIIKIISTPKKQNDTATTSVPWNIGLERLNLNNINLGFNNTPGKQRIAIKLGKATVDIEKMDVKNRIIELGNIAILQTGVILLTSRSEKQKETPNTRKKTFPWDLEAGNINLEEINVKTGNYGDTAMTFGISNLAMKLLDFKLNNNESALAIDNAKFDLDNGFSMKSMEGKIESGSEKTTIRLSVETTNSSFNIESIADKDLIGLISNPTEIKNCALSITDTELSLKDLYCFKPGLKEEPVFKALDKSPFRIVANAILQDSVIRIREIKIEKDKRLKIKLAGNLKNVLIKDKGSVELNLAISDIDIAWLKPIFKEAGLAEDLPEINMLSLKATLSGSMKSSEFTAGLSGDLGKMDITGTFGYNDDIFYAKTVFQNILPGKVLHNPDFGSLSGMAEVKGNGIRHKNITAGININIDSAGFKNYTYTQAKLKCKIDNKNYDIRVNVDDPALQCNLETFINTSGQILDFKSEGSFFVQLNKLNLYKDTLGIEGKLNAAFKKEKNLIESDLTLTDLKFTIPDNYSVLTQTAVSFNSDSLKTILLASGDFFNIDVKIERPLNELKQVLADYKRYAGSFIDSSGENRKKRISYLPEMKAEIKIRQHKTLGLVLKDTTFQYSGFEFNATNNLTANKIRYTMIGKNLKYKSIKIGDLNTTLTDSAGKMNLISSAENCSFMSRRLNKILINNKFFNRQGITDFTVFEKPDKILYDFEISTVLDTAGIVFSIPSKQLIMNGFEWQMETSDLALYRRSEKAFLIGVSLKNESSYINVTSDYAGGLNTKCEMNQVDISSLLPVHLIQGNPAGIISGKIRYSAGLNKEKEIDSELEFKDLAWSGINYRMINLTGNYKSGKLKDYTADIKASMDSSKIGFRASKPAEGSSVVNAEFNYLAIKDFQPFVKKYLSDLKGHISGNAKIIMSDNIENFDGVLDINGAYVRIITLNSLFKIPSDKIVFTGKRIVFDSFSVLDSLNNELIVDGSLDISKSGINSDLQILSKNLQVMGSTEKENPTFFGNIYVDSRLSIKGSVTSPDLKGNILLTGGTEIFFREKENLNLTETSKVLTFVSPSVKGQDAKPEKSINTRASIDAVVRIDPETKINFQLSKRLFNIDLSIQGGGELNYNMLANRDVTLAGRYEISDGTTDVKITGWPNKAFTITKGGYIRWDGKLEDPELNFEAVNKVHSSYTNPVDNKQRDADFNVTLKLANRLSTLDLRFTINTPDQYLMSIINSLSPEEQMRQAITILLFAKIDLPGISTSSDYMTEQVNQLVASQLNQLTKTTISGIDISFGIDSHVQATETGGQETKTSLSYEVKKALLNNRAQIEVSGRLNDVNKQPGASDLSLNNVSFEYRLDSAGTKFLKVYNEHTYEDVFEGEVVKTGVGLTYRKNYPTLRDIWRKKNKKTESKAR